MSHNHLRKEPTFGEPSANTVNSAEQVAEQINSDITEKSAVNAKVSLHSTKVPSYTFTPTMTRPVDETTTLKSIEETQLVKNESKLSTNVDNGTTDTIKDAEPVNKVIASEANELKSTAKNAGFTFSPVEDEAERYKAEAVKVEKTVTEEKPTMNTNNMERVIPVSNTEKPETPMAKVPSKFRRLGLVAGLAAVLAGIFFWLKPSAPETVEELQAQQGGSLPIEFRPVDEEEAKRAEAQAKAEQEAALAQQQAAQQTQQAATEPTGTAATNMPAETAPTTETTMPAENNSAPTETAPVVNKPVVQAEVAKPKTQGSVIHQSENKADNKKVEPKQPKVKAMTADEFNAKKAKNAQLDQLVKNVEQGKPVEKATAKVAKPTTTSAGVVSSKTLTVPKSTSLMQVFRDNKLNISDVNAMSKVNNVVSNLKVGERITVRLDKNNRVVEMNIGSGGKFTRQADGSYSFK
ncbi:LysM-like peptidoglycan-binding domain-containing protein [Actinobacillus pleuropneumoniae]|uniref:LysM-like peptidoglycan-binding domain-containing protein n=1 Tax=Actinobacillus pleuropneumoniae TaxID=715 RepID=UPI001F45D50D|nr:LysM-like peptidoglycan-binding domain-containing protein [Actinobacillus pleuropneumoniae]UKH16900.1 GlcNAc transferase [Actinobacillus pleuropneumoniae]